MSEIKIYYQINNKEPREEPFIINLDGKIKSITHKEIKSQFYEKLLELFNSEIDNIDDIVIDDIISEDNQKEKITYEFIRYYDNEYDAWVLLKESEVFKLKKKNELLIKVRIESAKENNIINQFIDLNNKIDDLSNNFDKKINNENNNINNNDSELDIAVLTANPLINIINENNKEEIKELISMNDFNNLTNSIYNIIKNSNKIINAEFLPLTINNLSEVIKLKPQIIHLICKSTYIIDDNNINNNDKDKDKDKNKAKDKVEFSENYANLIFEDDSYFNMRTVKKDDLAKIFKEDIIKNTVLIISTQLSQDIYEMVKDFKFKNILVQHTTITNSLYIEERNYLFYTNIIEQMNNNSIQDLYNNVEDMQRNLNIQFCCCSHHHKKTCKTLLQNLENELYFNDKDKRDENIIIPHFYHLKYACECKKWYYIHSKDCKINNKTNRSTTYICCCFKRKDIDEYQKKKNYNNIHEILFFGNFSEKTNINVKLGCGKDGIPIIKNTDIIPNYEIMKVISGRNKIVYDIYNELFILNNNFLNIYSNGNKTELIELTDIIIEYFKERSEALFVEDGIENIKRIKSEQSLSKKYEYSLKPLKSSPLPDTIYKDYFYFEKKYLKKNEKPTLYKKNCVYFLISVEKNDEIISEIIKTKKNLKIVFMTMNKINEYNIEKIELKKKEEINYKIKYQYEKIKYDEKTFNSLIRLKMVENKDIKPIEINLESNLKCGILYLFHLLKNELYQKELEEIFQIQNEKNINDNKKRDEIKKIEEELNNIENMIPKEIKADDNIANQLEKKMGNIRKHLKEEKKQKNIIEKDFNDLNNFIKDIFMNKNLSDISVIILEKEEIIINSIIMINELNKTPIEIIETDFKNIISTKINDKFILYKKVNLYDFFNTNYNNWKNKITDTIKGKILFKLFEYYSRLFRYLIDKFLIEYKSNSYNMKYSIKNQIFFTTFLENPNIGIWKENKEIESKKIDAIKNILPSLDTKFKFVDNTTRNFSNFFDINNIHLCMNNIEEENKNKVIKYIEDLSISYYICTNIFDIENEVISVFKNIINNVKEEYKITSLRFTLMDYMYNENIEHNKNYINKLDKIKEDYKKINCIEGELETIYAKFIVNLREKENEDIKNKEVYNEILIRLDKLNNNNSNCNLENKESFIKIFKNKVKYTYLRYYLKNDNFKKLNKGKKYNEIISELNKDITNILEKEKKMFYKIKIYYMIEEDWYLQEYNKENKDHKEEEIKYENKFYIYIDFISYYSNDISDKNNYEKNIKNKASLRKVIITINIKNNKNIDYQIEEDLKKLNKIYNEKFKKNVEWDICKKLFIVQ